MNWRENVQMFWLCSLLILFFQFSSVQIWLFWTQMNNNNIHVILFHFIHTIFRARLKKISMKNCMDDIPLNAVNLISSNIIYIWYIMMKTREIEEKEKHTQSLFFGNHFVNLWIWQLFKNIRFVGYAFCVCYSENILDCINLIVLFSSTSISLEMWIFFSILHTGKKCRPQSCHSKMQP